MLDVEYDKNKLTATSSSMKNQMNKKNQTKNKKVKWKKNNKTNWVKKCEKAKKLLQALFLH